MHLSGLFIHPVKSLRGRAVESAEVDALGLVGDRRFLVVDETGRFLTQRTLPRMARVTAAQSGDALALSAEGAGTVTESAHLVDHDSLVTMLEGLRLLVAMLVRDGQHGMAAETGAMFRRVCDATGIEMPE